MTLTLDRRHDIDADAFARVAWDGEPVVLSEAAEARIAERRASFMALVESDPDLVIYGVTTGYGERAKQHFSPTQRIAHARQPPVAPVVAFGEGLPERTVRGIVLARLANLIDGHAAVTPELARAVAALLDGRALPHVPAHGAGMAGEIVPLAHLFAPLARDFPLAEKEALSLISGSPVAAALVADAARIGWRRLALMERVLALSIEALGAPLEAYDPALAALWQDPDEGDALTALHPLIGGTAPRRPYQAPVSWRVVPRLLGRFRRALRQADEVAAASLSAVTDNPVYLPPDERHPLGRVLSNGGYHNASAAPALDALAAAQADLALLADRQAGKLMDGAVSRLPHQLMAGDGYLGTLGFAAAGFAEEARQAAQTTLIQGSEGGGFGQNDTAVPVMHAWRRHRDAGRAAESAFAVLACVARQAFYVTDTPPPAALADTVDEIAAAFPPVVEARPLADGVEALVGRWRTRTEPE